MVIDISKPHYRLISRDGDIEVVCVQHCDYPDYDFWSEETFATEDDAQEVADDENLPYDEYHPNWVAPCECWCECCGCNLICEESQYMFDDEEEDE